MNETTHFEHIVETACNFIDASNGINGAARQVVEKIASNTGTSFPDLGSPAANNAAMVKFVCDLLNIEGMDENLANSKATGVFGATGEFRLKRAEFIRTGRAFLQEAAIVGYMYLAEHTKPDSLAAARGTLTPERASRVGLHLVGKTFADFERDAVGQAIVNIPPELQDLFGIRGIIHDDKRRLCVLGATEFMQSEETRMYPSFAIVSSAERAVGSPPFPQGIPILAGPTVRRSSQEPAHLS